MNMLIAVAWLALASPGLQQCEGTRNTVELVDCLEQELAQINSQLDERVASVEGELPGRAKVLFTRAQNAWKLFRDIQCESEAYRYVGGTMAPVAEMQCHLRLSTARVTELGLVYSADREAR